jgi:amphiphysin
VVSLALVLVGRWLIVIQVEQDFELAAGEYEHHNNLLKTELPTFLQMATRFIDPLFHSFYYMQ